MKIQIKQYNDRNHICKITDNICCNVHKYYDDILFKSILIKFKLLNALKFELFVKYISYPDFVMPSCDSIVITINILEQLRSVSTNNYLVDELYDASIQIDLAFDRNDFNNYIMQIIEIYELSKYDKCIKILNDKDMTIDKIKNFEYFDGELVQIINIVK